MEQDNPKFISGFSKLSRQDKIKLLKDTYHLPDSFSDTLHSYLREDNQALFDEFSENTLSNFILPFGVAPNFLIDDKWVAVPMVTEESSVIAAASKAARFWASHGGFKTTIVNTIKTGQIHFEWHGVQQTLENQLEYIAIELKSKAAAISEGMQNRGGGILEFKVISIGEPSLAFWQLLIEFETLDSMGANYINSCLEAKQSSTLTNN
jgi:hydroxymethylglutaryl-CoA reductase